MKLPIIWTGPALTLSMAAEFSLAEIASAESRAVEIATSVRIPKAIVSSVIIVEIIRARRVRPASLPSLTPVK